MLKILEVLPKITLKRILKMCLTIFLVKMFFVKVFSLKVFLGESPIKCFFRNHYKIVFGSDSQKCF